MLGTFDLTVFLFTCSITVISTFDTACFFVIINLSAVALFVLGESFNFSNCLGEWDDAFDLPGSSLNCNKVSQTEIFTK